MANTKRTQTVKIGDVSFEITEQPMSVAAPLLDAIQARKVGTDEWMLLMRSAVSDESGPLGDRVADLLPREYARLVPVLSDLHLPDTEDDEPGK